MPSLSSIPGESVYLVGGEPLPVRAALGRVFASTDLEFVVECVSHYCGYVREAAIRRAAELGGSTVVASIVERLNDWVPEVRDTAARALLTLLATVPPACFVSLLPRLRSLMLATRADHRAWLFDFEAQLIQVGGASSIVEAIYGTDLHLRRSAYFVSIDHRLLPTSEIVTSGLLSGDIVLARHAASLIGCLAEHERESCVALAAASPFGPVRHAVFRLVAGERIDPENEPFVWRCLFDVQGSLRAAAAQRLTRAGKNVAARCVSLLANGTLNTAQIRAGLSLLIELRAPEAAAMLERFARDPRTLIRAHALLLQAKITPSLRDQLAARALIDPMRKVRKAGIRLCALGAFVSLEQIRAMLVRTGDCHAALVVCRRDRWDTLCCVAIIAELEAASQCGDVDLKEALRQWLRNPRSLWTRPGNQHREASLQPGTIKRLLDLAGDEAVELRCRLQEGGLES